MRRTAGLSSGQCGQDDIRDTVCILGAGFSGLAVARTLRERHIPFTCVDSGIGVGGLWHDSGALDDGPAYQSLHLNTSRDVTGYTGFPMPAAFPRYPRHAQVSSYLAEFATRYGLSDHIELRTEVTEVAKHRDNTWSVRSRRIVDGAVEHRRFRHLVIATGQHWTPETPTPPIPGSADFTGEQLHSFAYSEPSRFAGKHVLVLGIGNSACDIAVELSRVAETTILAMRRGAHVVPKQMLGIPIDEIAASNWWSWLPFQAQRRMIELLLRIIRGSITDYGIPQPDHRIFSAPVTISDELLSRISHGEITVKPAISRMGTSAVHFADGSSAQVNTVIYCTGYRLDFPFLDPELVFSPAGQVRLYHRVLPPEHRGLYFAGLIRPVGSITRLVEAQAEWIADLIDGSVVAPGAARMTEEIDRHLTAAAARYGTSAMDSIHVDFGGYLRTISAERKAAARRAGGSVRAVAYGPAPADGRSAAAGAERSLEEPASAVRPG